MCRSMWRVLRFFVVRCSQVQRRAELVSPARSVLMRRSLSLDAAEQLVWQCKMRSVSIVFTVAYTNAASMNMHGVLSEHVEEPVTPFHITNMPILWKAVFCCIGADCRVRIFCFTSHKNLDECRVFLGVEFFLKHACSQIGGRFSYSRTLRVILPAVPTR